MPSRLVARLDLDKLYHPFLEPLLETLAACEKHGDVYVATLGYRTFAEQAKIYFQGRTTPGKIVTNARPGLSCHNYGIAVDLVLDATPATAKLDPDWNGDHYRSLAEEGRKQGLQVGVPSVAGGDKGHVQLPLVERLHRHEADVLADLKRAYDGAPGEVAGLRAAWTVLDGLGFGKA